MRSTTCNSMSIPVELPSRSASRSSGQRPLSHGSFLAPYMLPNVSSSYSIGRETLPESISGGSTRSSIPSHVRCSSRTSTPSSSRLQMGVVTSRSSRSTLSLPQEDVSELATPSETTVASGTSSMWSHPRLKANPKSLNPIPEVSRYDRKIEIPLKSENDQFIVEKMRFDFDREGVPEGWKDLAHPEGALYFFNQDRRIYTDAYICDQKIFYEVMAFADFLEEYIQNHNISIPSGADLVLELQPDDDGSTTWNYYFAHNELHILFWVHDFDITWWVSELIGQITMPHMRLELEKYYWQHVESFPHGHTLDPTNIDKLIGILSHAWADQATSMTPTMAIFPAETLRQVLSMAEGIKQLGSTPEAISMHARLMCVFTHPRFLNYYGEHGARLSRDQSVHNHDPKRRSLFIKFFALVLWNAPYPVLRTLENIWVDKMLCLHPWQQFTERLKSEWQEFVLFATVLLNANVAFLALPNVDSGNLLTGPGETPTVAQVLSQISAFTSVGSIIIGLILIRQYRTKPRSNVEEAANFLLVETHPNRGVETLAILYSLPYALLMWSMLTFLVAFSASCFETPNRAARCILAIIWALGVSLVLWCISAGWERQGSSGPQNLRSQLLGKFRSWQTVIYDAIGKLGKRYRSTVKNESQA